MATKINKKDQKLGFDSDTFKMIIRKPKKDSVWFECELTAGSSNTTNIFKESEVPEKLAARMKKTIEAFIDSSFESLVLEGKVLK